MERRIAPSARIEDDGRLAELGRLGARLVIQRAIDDEVTAFLGRARYERAPTALGSRNGTRPRRVQTAEGEITVAVPQVRDSLVRFVSSVIPDVRGIVRTRPSSPPPSLPTSGETPDLHCSLTEGGEETSPWPSHQHRSGRGILGRWTRIPIPRSSNDRGAECSRPRTRRPSSMSSTGPPSPAPRVRCSAARALQQPPCGLAPAAGRGMGMTT